MSINGISGSVPLPLPAVTGQARTDIDSVMAQIRSMRAQSSMEALRAGGVADIAAPSTDVTKGGSFGPALKTALDSVNQLQKDSGAKAEAFAAGRSDDLVGTMLAMQKSDVAFQATIQVRNRLVTAYQDIMNMPI